MRQRGVLPILTNTTGLVGYGVTAILCVDIAVYVVTQNRATQIDYSGQDFLIDTFGSMIIGIMVLSPIWLISRFFLTIFPLVDLDPRGIRVHILTHRDLILWSEIYNIVEYKNGIIAIFISRKGFYLLNGLYFHKLCGFLVKHEDPVLFLAPKLESREVVLQEIMKNSPAKIARTSGNLYT